MNRCHISSADTTRKLPHLASHTSKMPPVLDCDIGLVIGYDCSCALKQRHVNPVDEDGPVAIKTDLGWSIVGITDSDCDDNDAKYSH